jgi:hypothetical protein
LFYRDPRCRVRTLLDYLGIDYGYFGRRRRGNVSNGFGGVMIGAGVSGGRIGRTIRHSVLVDRVA